MKIRFHQNDWQNDQFLEHISKDSGISLDKLNNISLLNDTEKQKVERYRQIFAELLSPLETDIDYNAEKTDFLYNMYKDNLKFGQVCLEIEEARLEKESKKDKII